MTTENLVRWYTVRYKGQWTKDHKAFCSTHIRARWSAGVSQYYEMTPDELKPADDPVCVDCLHEQKS